MKAQHDHPRQPACAGGQNLLRAEQVDGEPRFGMLRTIQAYTLELLQASGELQAWCMGGTPPTTSTSVERAVQALHGPDGRAVAGASGPRA